MLMEKPVRLLVNVSVTVTAEAGMVKVAVLENEPPHVTSTG